MVIYNSSQPRIPLVIYHRSKDQILPYLHLIDIQRLNRSIIVLIYGRDERLIWTYFPT